MKSDYHLLKEQLVKSTHIKPGYNHSNFSLVSPMDYTALDEIVIFCQCEVRKCVNLSIAEDLVDERDELFTYHLTSDVALHPRIKLSIPSKWRIQNTGQ